MDSDRINRWLSLGANLGVLTGIFFLAYELRQNNYLLEAQAREAKLDRRTSFNLMVASNPDFARIRTKATQGEALTATELVQQEAFNRAVLASWEWQFNEYKRGRLEFDDLAIPSWRIAFMESGVGSGMTDTWSKWKTQAAPSFIEFMEENVVRSKMPSDD